MVGYKKNLQKILNEEVFRIYEEKSLINNYLNVYPFKHVVINHFFSNDFVDLIVNSVKSLSLECAPQQKETIRANLEWGAYSNVDVIKAVYGAEFREFVAALLGCPVFMGNLTVPQFNRFGQASGGLQIHNDMYEKNKREIVMLINLSRGYSSGLGGELYFHRDDQNRTVFRTVPPLFNTVVFFEVTPISWHSVADMKAGWNREVLMFDWYKRQSSGV